jgi:hypothetical protein
MIEEGQGKTETTEKNEIKEEIFSKAVRAGKRTYFFDVKSTRKDDYYLTITESKKRFNRDGRFFYEKHKIFLYKEDFDKFVNGLEEVVEFIKKERPITEFERKEQPQELQEEVAVAEDYTNVEFEDLGEKE